MIYIKKENNKNLSIGESKPRKEFFKTISIIGVCVFVLVEVFIYASQYYTNNNLCFTQEDKFLFTLFIAGIVLVCSLVVYLIIKQKTLTNLLKQVYEAIIDSEDNIVRLQRNTQEMILKFFNSNKG